MTSTPTTVPTPARMPTAPRAATKVLLVAKLLPNRDLAGIMDIYIDAHLQTCMWVLGRGSRGGAGPNQFLKNNDTPTGTYRITRYEPRGDRSITSYGAHGVLRLQPESGNAKAAEVFFNRSHLLIHGGSPSSSRAKPFKKNPGDLHPTMGCLRVSDGDMAKLVQLIKQSGADMNRGHVMLVVTENGFAVA